MINVNGLGRVRTAASSTSARLGGAGRGEFAKLLGGSSARAGASAASSLGGIEGLLAAQEAGDGTHGGSKGRARAEALLDSLDELRSDLLSGGVSAGRLRAITDLVASQREAVEDPRLAGILDEIDLRAQVELAKLIPVAA